MKGKKSRAIGPSRPDNFPGSCAARVKEYDQPDSFSALSVGRRRCSSQRSGLVPRGRSKFRFPKQQRQNSRSYMEHPSFSAAVKGCPRL